MDQTGAANFGTQPCVCWCCRLFFGVFLSICGHVSKLKVKNSTFPFKMNRFQFPTTSVWGFDFLCCAARAALHCIASRCVARRAQQVTITLTRRKYRMFNVTCQHHMSHHNGRVSSSISYVQHLLFKDHVCRAW